MNLRGFFELSRAAVTRMLEQTPDLEAKLISRVPLRRLGTARGLTEASAGHYTRVSRGINIRFCATSDGQVV